MPDALAATISDHHRTKRRGRDWALPPAIQRARASREPKKPQLPVAFKPAPVEVVEVVAIAPAPIEVHGRVLARFSDYDGLHRAIAARAAALQLTRAEIDHLSGNQDGYTAKVLAPTQYRKFGPVSLGNTVGALGCYLLLIEDETETQKLLSSPPGPRPKSSGRLNHGGSIADLGEKLGAIGCTLALIEDPRATEKIMKRAKKRRRPLRALKLLSPPSQPAD
jgi:hypothetical protein